MAKYILNCLLVVLILLASTTKQDHLAYNNFQTTDAEVLRRDLINEETDAPGPNGPIGGSSYYAGSYDLVWNRFDYLNFDVSKNFKSLMVNGPPTQSPCAMALFPLPSGGRFCRVPKSIKKSFYDADDFCKLNGFTGLAEAHTKEDAVRIAGITVWFNWKGHPYTEAPNQNVPGFFDQSDYGLPPETESDNIGDGDLTRWLGAKYDTSSMQFKWLTDGTPVDPIYLMTGKNPGSGLHPTNSLNQYVHMTQSDAGYYPYWQNAQIYLDVGNLNPPTLPSKFFCFVKANDQSCKNGSTSSSPMFFSLSACSRVPTPTNTRIYQFIPLTSPITDNTNYVLQCNKDQAPGIQFQSLINEITTSSLPKLRHSYFSFHHAGGLVDGFSPDCSLPVPCSINASVNLVLNDNLTSNQILDSKPVFVATPDKLFNDDDVTLDTATNWKFEYLRLPPISEGYRLQLRSEFDLVYGGVGFDNLMFQTQQRCMARWSSISGFMFAPNVVDQNIRVSPSEFEYSGISSWDLTQKYYMTNSLSASIEFCARLCLLGSGCDMFEYSGSSGKCRFFPHNPLKKENIFKVITRDQSAQRSMYILQCSTPSENLIKNSDLSTQSYYGWSKDTDCSQTGIYEQANTYSSKSTVNGKYQFQDFSLCDKTKHYTKSQIITLPKDFSYGVNGDYLTLVKPVAVLRTWVGAVDPGTKTHKLNLKVDFIGANAKSVQFDQTFSEQGTDADDTEYSYIIKDFQGFESITFTQTVTSTSNGRSLLSGPLELLFDVPFEMGCYKVLVQSAIPSGTDENNLTPASCLVICINQNLRFAALMEGHTCICMDKIPMDQLLHVDDEMCSIPCSGDANYMCGDVMAVSIFVATCPDNNQVRFGDSCIQPATVVDNDIITTIDACSDKGSYLWYPESSTEITFVLNNFPATTGTYYVGIEQYVSGNGMFLSDNTFGVGLPFITENKSGVSKFPPTVNTISNLISSATCVTMDTTGILQYASCPISKGLCKSKIADGQGYQMIGSLVEFKLRSSKTNPAPLSVHGTKPIYIQLEDDPTVSKRFVEVSLSKQVVISGLSFQTPEKMALQAFSFWYVERGVQYPDWMNNFTRLQNDIQVFYLKRGSFSTTSLAPIERNIYLPRPIVTDKFKVVVEAGATPLVFKMDIIGIEPTKKYTIDPMLSPQTYKDYMVSDLTWTTTKYFSVANQNICPGGSAYFRILPTSHQIGNIILSVAVGQKPPTGMQIDISVQPFQILISSNTYGTELPIPPVIGKPFDFLITCEPDTFKIYVDGQLAASTLSLFHQDRDATNSIIVPQVIYITYTANNKGMIMNKVSWTYVPPEGILTTMSGMGASVPNLLQPQIDGFIYQSRSLMKDQSAFLTIYQTSNKTETRYIPVQALQNCFRNGQGNVRCTTVEGTFDPSQSLGFGGNSGIGSMGCPPNYNGVGKQCIFFPDGDAVPVTVNGSIFSDAVDYCSQHNGDLVYSPIDSTQNAVIRSVLSIWQIDKIWVNVQKDTAGIWRTKTGTIVTQFISDWAAGEPAKAAGANCAAIYQSAGYKWKTVNCNDPSVKTMCQIKVPNCPYGYTWLYQLGQACFKITQSLNISIGAFQDAEHPIANSLCAQDNTRLAVPESVPESNGLFKWLSMKYPIYGSARFMLGFRIFKDGVTFETKNYLVAENTVKGILIDYSFSIDGNCAIYFKGQFPLRGTCYQDATVSSYGICEYVEGDAINTAACVFPFRYKNRIYDRCVTHANYGVPWCATSVNTTTYDMLPKQMANCQSNVKVNDCPIGFRWVYPEGTCYRYTTPLPSETVTSFDDAEAKCIQWGGRLFQPRSTASLAYFSNAENIHMKIELFRFLTPPSHSILAIGLLYQQLGNDTSPVLYYKDGSKVSDLMLSVLTPLWASNYPTQDPHSTCVALVKLQLVNVPCNNVANTYYDFSTDTDYSKPLLGYLCETRQISTQSGSDSCYFPFQYQGKTYTSCSLENNTALNSNGLPWCVTDITTGSLALCQDERTIIYNGSGAGTFCPMPFLYNRQYYDKCTRKSSSQQTGFEDFYWCPNPLSVNTSNQNLFTPGGYIGQCNNFLIPTENGCNDQYDGATDTLCIRVSSYPETYEDAQARCNLEGGQLLQDTSADIHRGISAVIGAKMQNIPRLFKGIRQMWLGADFSNTTKWQWRGYYKQFTDFTFWESGLVNIGCFASGCTPADGLILRPDTAFVWNAFVDKSKALPYVCMSNCTRGFLWIPSVGKCLQVVHSANQSVTIGQAMVACALQQARLVPVRSCDQLTLINQGIFDQYQKPNNEYFIGLSVYSNATGVSSRNWEPVKIMDSMGYGADAFDMNSGACAMSSSGQSYVSIKVINRNTFSVAANSFLSPTSAGYICEKENLWGCEPGYVLLDVKCYKLFRSAKMFVEAEMVCQNDGGTIAKPETFLQHEFLKSLIQSSDSANGSISLRTWINYRRQNGSDEDFVQFVPGASPGPGLSPDCFVYSPSDTGTTVPSSIIREFCNQPSFFICQMEQTLSQNFQPYLPTPLGIWPLSKLAGPTDASESQIQTNESWIAYDTLYTPAGLLGSPMFTKELNGRSFMEMAVSSKFSGNLKPQISILGWIRPDATDEGTVLSWHSLDPKMGINLIKSGGQLFNLSIFTKSNTTILKSLASYPMVIGKWHFFAIVLDGQARQGFIQIDYSYGYNNGSLDFKMEYFPILNTDWLEGFYYSNLKIGSDITNSDGTQGPPFHGSLSCLQIYTTALNIAQIQNKKNCTDASSYLSSPCPTGYQFYDGTCIQVPLAKAQFASGEVGCVPSVTSPHRSQLLNPYNHRQIEYAMELAFNTVGATSIWVGCDDADDDGSWTDSLGKPVTPLNFNGLFYNSTIVFDGFCCIYVRGSAGYVSTDDCSLTYQYICETEPLTIPSDYPCPNGFYPHKDDCLNPVQQIDNYDAATLNCAGKGSHILPIKDKSTYNFISAWASKVVPMDFWVGLRAQTVSYIYNPSSIISPLSEIPSTAFSYSDGTSFDKTSGYMIGATKLTGECLYLKQSSSFAVADSSCNKMKGYICKWSKPTCPIGYEHMGQLSDGRTCFGAPSAQVIASTDTCTNPLKDLLRDRWIPSTPYQVDWFRRQIGQVWVDASLNFGGNWTVSDQLMVQSSYSDLRQTGFWADMLAGIKNTTGCLELTSTGLLLPLFNDTCDTLVNKQSCFYKACMTKTGKQCILPFTYHNTTSPVLDYNVCSTLDVYKPWCPTALSSSGTIIEWGECLPDCPMEQVTSVCIMEPEFPAWADGSDGSRNFTTNYIHGSMEATLDLDYIYFTCPEGYVFQNSINVTQYAFCRNWEFVYLFDKTKTCVPVVCPSTPPYFAPNTPIGTWDWDMKSVNYSTTINYICPEGFVFQIYQDIPDPTVNFGLIVNETTTTTVTCAAWGKWNPPVLPLCIPKNCTTNPVIAPNNDKGMFDWNSTIASRSYSFKVNYWCPKFGWGFPSSGLSSISNVCQGDKSWNLTSLETCVVLPCPTPPPTVPTGGWMWYGMEFVKYKCPNGYYFQSGNYPFWYSNCTVVKTWEPPNAEPCVRRICSGDPPAPWIGIDMDWPLKKNTLGAIVTYNCPYRTKTFSEELAVQYVQCIWDKDVDEMIWYPSTIDICNKTIPPTGNILVLPTYPSYAIQYPDTTDYYWPQISVDDPTFFVNSTGKTTPSPITDGPFGFGKAISVSLNKCIVKSHYGILYDTCILDPTNCKDGFSMSIWEKVTFPSEIFNLQMPHPKTTIVSSGGDFDPVTNTSYRGYAIFHEGMDVQAVMVTQYDVYYVNVRGQLLNNSWTNFGFRFIEYINSTTIPYLQRGGLELYINGLKVGQAVVPLDRPIGGWKQGKVLTPIPSDPTWRGIDINPPIIMIGCQRTSADKKFRNFGLQNAAYDELTIWTRRLGTNKSVDETLYFTGGYVPQFDGVAPGDWKNMLKRVELSDPGQQQMAGVITTMMAGVNGGQQTNANYSSGVFNRTLQENVDYNNQILQLETALQLLDMTGLILTPLARAKYLYKRFSVLAAVSTSLAETPTNIAGWGSVHLDPNEPGSSFLLNRTDNYILQYASSANILHDESIPNVYSANRSEFVVHSSSPGLTMSVTKVLPQNFNKYPETIDLARFYSSHKVAPTNQWYNFLETIQIPNSWQFTNNSYCQGQPFTLLTAIYDGYGKLAPNRRAPQFIPSEEFKLDSKAVSVKMKVNPFPNGDLTQNFSQCFLDEVAMKYTPIRIRFYHIDNQTSLRKLLWHENELQTDIALRRCVVYRHDIGLTGAWDTDSCTTVMTDQMSTICECSNFGTFAVEAEYVDPASYGAEFTWVGVVKYMGYIFSLILLVVFFFTIILSTELWDQFHILRCHTSFVCFMALLSMMITEVEFVRTDRHSNIVISIMQQYWFQAFSFFLFSESFATFRAITGGIIGGKTLAYIPISYGMPFICTGLAVYLYGSDFGTDPRAFIGWENATKQVFFYGQLPTASVTLLICLVIVFNLSLPQTRKDSIIDQLANQGNGLSIMAFIFLMTWAFAYPAYIRYPGAEVPDFYPIFIILNSWSGVFIFCLLGIISKPFRAALLGGGGLRSNPLFMYMQTGQKIEDDFKDLSRTPSSTSLASQPDSLDEDIEKGLPEPKEEKKEEPAPEPKKEESDDDSDDSDDSDESDDDDKKDKKKEEEEEDDDDDGDGDLLG